MEENLKKEFKTNLEISQKYEFELIRDGKVIDTWEFENLVTTEGLNTYLDYTLKTGQASPLWYVGLKNTGAPAAGDTMASHAGWTENVTYTEGTRPVFTPGAISGGSVSNTASKASFAINGTTEIFGAFLTSNSTKSGTTGLLLGVGDFGASRPVLSGDTLNVTITCTITSA